MLMKASRPVIIAGGGIKNERAHEVALSLAEAINCPIVTSPGHGDALPFGHRLNAGRWDQEAILWLAPCQRS